jgi:hypothetical protein
MDPYVAIEFENGNTKETFVHGNAGLHAKWNQKFNFELKSGWDETVTLFVKDKCKMRSDPIIG